MNEIVKKNGINFGLISGLIGVLVTTVMYAVDLKLFVNMWIGFALLAVWIIIGILLLKKCKKENNDQLTFKEGFTAYFISALIGILISTVFNIFLFNFFDVEARDIITEHFIDFQVGIMERFNAPQSEIAKAVEKIKENSQFSIKGQMYGVIQSLIGSIIFGLILAAIFKTKRKEIF